MLQIYFLVFCLDLSCTVVYCKCRFKGSNSHTSDPLNMVYMASN